VAGEALVEVRAEGRSAVIVLRREHKLNALSMELERALAAALAQDDVRSSACVLFTGGERAFSAGADVGELRNLDPASVLAYYRDSGDVYERVAALPQPTISAIAGYCLGAGFELALATDFRLADRTAVFGFPEVALGIVPSSGGMHRLVRLLGAARAKELVLLGDRFDADEASTLGLLTEVVSEGAALQRALELAERLSAQPRLAVSLAKQALDRMPEASREAGLALERLAYGLLAQTDDARAAAATFGDNR
jgi:enoyl-CoA hydratase/carnithine racemase